MRHRGEAEHGDEAFWEKGSFGHGEDTTIGRRLGFSLISLLFVWYGGGWPVKGASG
ncbi:pollen-specific leucine-rich repeat extensin-like protein 3 [Iris pallida]|uniref:Pollen-specific leucine-rich repeat extensin-like protein 3 n=1 Tax=Iris pallida TaxID=29817 RepID=A0AAX6EWT3_IRIPA|nr:pollen-specific leucine-rich repeat extensin-like protein 3 [Iris pallida]KAJ6841001.1 pollen-specific leucine-rich repeat extensin-like protein 3 [Iris pallida]